MKQPIVIYTCPHCSKVHVLSMGVFLFAQLHQKNHGTAVIKVITAGNDSDSDKHFNKLNELLDNGKVEEAAAYANTLVSNTNENQSGEIDSVDAPNPHNQLVVIEPPSRLDANERLKWYQAENARITTLITIKEFTDEQTYSELNTLRNQIAALESQVATNLSVK